MKKWLDDVRESSVKKAMPILSFPSVQLLGVSVKELIADSETQAKGMKMVAERTDASAAVSLMDLSVEAECFGAATSVTDDEVPTVKHGIIDSIYDVDQIVVPSVDSGRCPIYIGGVRMAKAEIKAAESVKKIGFGTMIRRIFTNIFSVL